MYVTNSSHFFFVFFFTFLSVSSHFVFTFKVIVWLVESFIFSSLFWKSWTKSQSHSYLTTPFLNSSSVLTHEGARYTRREYDFASAATTKTEFSALRSSRWNLCFSRSRGRTLWPNHRSESHNGWCIKKE